MNRKVRRTAFLLCFILALFALVNPVKVHAENEIIPISNYEDLCRLATEPDGHFRLEKDIDLSGKIWAPADFSGSLDGNGHSLLNVTINSTGSKTETTYDGNMKEYETSFAGFFSTLNNATVKNLNIINIRADIDLDKPCFVGGITGYMNKSLIENCTVSGYATLKADAPMFGMGGFAGFGNGEIKKCQNDMTLVCIDKNTEEKDEQFLGGAYGAGYISIDSSSIIIHGYDSDHGYVHNGGITGMFGLYPAGFMTDTYITNTHVEGKITFFEHNEDRRAYCKPYCGEVLNWTYEWTGCSENFEVDERFEYDKILLPEMCANPEYSAEITGETDTSYGFTTYTCKTCGYSYTDKYVLHTTDLKALEEQKSAETTSALPETSPKESAQEESSDNEKKGPDIMFIALVSIMSFLIIILIIIILNKKATKRS